jgi:hypothetical protein
MHIQEKEEREIAIKLIDAILAAGCAISVHEGEDWAIDENAKPVIKCKDRNRIGGSLASTDYDSLMAYRDGVLLGQFVLIYGNGEDLISDCTDNQFCNDILMSIVN